MTALLCYFGNAMTGFVQLWLDDDGYFTLSCYSCQLFELLGCLQQNLIKLVIPLWNVCYTRFHFHFIVGLNRKMMCLHAFVRLCKHYQFAGC